MRLLICAFLAAPLAACGTEARAPRTDASPAAGPAPASAAPSATAKPGPVAALRVSYRLDPRLTRGVYMGDRWVSPVSHRPPASPAPVQVEARVDAVDAAGRPVPAQVSWAASDAALLGVVPAQGRQVSIAVRAPGRAKLRLEAAGFVHDLLVSAVVKGGVLQVEIAQ